MAERERWHPRRYGRLKWLRDSNLIVVNQALVRLVSLLRLAPPGLREVHDMLVKVSLSLVQVRPRPRGRARRVLGRGLTDQDLCALLVTVWWWFAQGRRFVSGPDPNAP